MLYLDDIITTELDIPKSGSFHTFNLIQGCKSLLLLFQVYVYPIFVNNTQTISWEEKKERVF